MFFSISIYHTSIHIEHIHFLIIETNRLNNKKHLFQTSGFPCRPNYQRNHGEVLLGKSRCLPGPFGRLALLFHDLRGAINSNKNTIATTTSCLEIRGGGHVFFVFPTKKKGGKDDRGGVQGEFVLLFCWFFLAVFFCKVGKEVSETQKSTNIIEVGGFCCFFEGLVVLYTFSHNHGSVENGCIQKITIYYWRYTRFSLNHDYGRKGIFCTWTKFGGWYWMVHSPKLTVRPWK